MFRLDKKEQKRFNATLSTEKPIIVLRANLAVSTLVGSLSSQAGAELQRKSDGGVRLSFVFILYPLCCMVSYILVILYSVLYTNSQIDFQQILQFLLTSQPLKERLVFKINSSSVFA